MGRKDGSSSDEINYDSLKNGVTFSYVYHRYIYNLDL